MNTIRIEKDEHGKWEVVHGPLEVPGEYAAGTRPSYHDLHITTVKFSRRAISDLPYGYELICSRVRGWSLWFKGDNETILVAEEFHGRGEGMRLDIAGHVILDSLTTPEED